MNQSCFGITEWIHHAEWFWHHREIEQSKKREIWAKRINYWVLGLTLEPSPTIPKLAVNIFLIPHDLIFDKPKYVLQYLTKC